MIWRVEGSPEKKAERAERSVETTATLLQDKQNSAGLASQPEIKEPSKNVCITSQASKRDNQKVSVSSLDKSYIPKNSTSDRLAKLAPWLNYHSSFSSLQVARVALTNSLHPIVCPIKRRGGIASQLSLYLMNQMS
jgi:hypothetical protein